MRHSRVMKPIIVFLASYAAFTACFTSRCVGADAVPRTTFQTPSPWMPGLAIPSDSVMVYGVNPDALRAWASHGYAPWSMFGASWLGKDEQIVREHPEIKQTGASGIPFEMIQGRAWVVPTEPWREHIKGIVRSVLDAGALAISPEEPEFFAVNGYSASFKEEWGKFYGEPWQAPHSSPALQWKSNRLKSHLFTEFYRDVFSFAKNHKPERPPLCLPAVHSNINYADWGIVAPHFAIMNLPQTDGLIGQAWTGTAKHSHALAGAAVKDTFSYAFLEYSYFANLAAGTGKPVWLLADPVEDAPGASWDNLRNWYEETLTAALLQPMINSYEITPWPDRVLLYSGTYGGKEQPTIPEEYATELFSVWAAQRVMPEGNAQAEKFYDTAGSESVGFLTADTLMWQVGVGMRRFDGHAAPMLSLVRRGIPVSLLPAELMGRAGFPGQRIRTIVASFDAWKPESPAIVDSIAEWVKSGGTLVFLGGSDGYDSMPGAWWKSENRESPADALLARLLPSSNFKKAAIMPKPQPEGISLLGGGPRKLLTPAESAPAALASVGKINVVLPVTAIGADGASTWFTSGGKPVVWQAKCGKGNLIYAGFSGESVAQQPEGEKLFATLVRTALDTTPGSSFSESDRLVMRRGPFVVAHSMASEFKISGGPFASIYRPENGFTNELTVPAKGNAFALDLKEATKIKPGEKTQSKVLLAGGTVSNEKSASGSFSFTITGPEKRFGIALVSLPDAGKAPANAEVTMDNGTKQTVPATWEPTTRVAAFRVPLSPTGSTVDIKY